MMEIRVNRVSNKVLILLFFLVGLSVKIQASDFLQVVNELLQHDADYQKIVSSSTRNRAMLDLNKSVNSGELNLEYKGFSNDISREEIKGIEAISEGISNITEDEQSWKVELSKSLFPLDFDQYDDSMGGEIDLMEYDYKLFYVYLKSCDKIIGDYIKWYEAEEMIPVVSSELKILSARNASLLALREENISSSWELAENLEQILEKESKLSEYESLCEGYEMLYDISLSEFVTAFEGFIAEENTADTLKFMNICDQVVSRSGGTAKKIKRQIGRAKFYSYLPEVRGSVSYNWIDQDQSWDIWEDEEYTKWERTQSEAYPELSLELSMPLNLLKNVQGKLSLLSSHESNLKVNQRLCEAAVNGIKESYVGKLDDLQGKMEVREQLLQLYIEIKESHEARANSSYTLPGDYSLKEESVAEIKYQKNKIKYMKAQMQYNRQVFLINNAEGYNK